MRLLEQHLKTTLFERLPRGVALTDMGKAYAQPVRKGLDDIQVATSGLFGAAKRQQVKVRASISYAALVIAPRLHDFLASHPHIDVELSTFVWANRFQDGISDIDIRYGFGDWADGDVTHLGHEYAVPVCHPDYLARFGQALRFDELAARHMIKIKGSEADWPQLLQQMGLTVPVHARITHLDSSLMALQSLSTGPGIAIVLENFAQHFVKRGLVVQPVKEKIAIGPAHYIVAREGAEKKEEVRAFSDWVKAFC